MFKQHARHLRQIFPGQLEITGGNHPPPMWKQLAARALGWASIAVIGLAMAGPFLASALGWAQPPAPIAWLQANRGAALAVYFITNMLSSGLLATGAFEVALDGAPLYSALASGGRIPTVQHLAGLLAAAGLVPAPHVAEALAAAAAAGVQ